MNIRTERVLGITVAVIIAVVSGLGCWQACRQFIKPVEPVSVGAITKARLAKKLDCALEHHGKDCFRCVTATDTAGRDPHQLALIAECEEAVVASSYAATYLTAEQRVWDLATKQEELAWLSDLRKELAKHAELARHVTSLPAEMSADQQETARQMAVQHYRERIGGLADQYATNALDELSTQTAIVSARMRSARFTKAAAAGGATLTAMVVGLLAGQLVIRRLRAAQARCEAAQLERSRLARRNGEGGGDPEGRRLGNRIDTETPKATYDHTPAPARAADSPFESTEVLDVTQALQQLSGNTELLTDLINTAASTLGALLSDLTDWVDSESFEQACDIAHSIKGACAGIGAHEAFTAAFACEVALRSSEGDQAHAATLRLVDAIERLMPQLTQYQMQAANDVSRESL